MIAYVPQITYLQALIKEILELIGIIIIIIGALISTFNYFKDLFTQIPYDVRTNRIRIRLGQSIVSGLELIVAADVISTTIDQTYQTLGILILTIIIRIALGYFLGRDINSISPAELKKIEG